MAREAWTTNIRDTPDPAGYQVDDLTVDLGPRRVRRAGTVIPLKALSFDLLVTLVRAAPNLLSFEQLSERVWPGLVVTPETIVQRVKLLRDALGDDPQSPRYIEGVRGRGYRLIARVAPWDVGAATTDDSKRAAQGPTAVRPESQLAFGALEAAATAAVADSTAVRIPRSSVATLRSFKFVFGAIGAVIAAVLVYFTVDKFLISKQLQVASHRASTTAKTTLTTSVTVEAVDTAFNPPPYSIAVLPFVNISGDKEQEYFSDGLTDELRNSLARVRGLQVTGRTSTFYFKGEHADLPIISHKLNVAAILEGSVRRSEHTVRVSAQLVNAITGFGLWSQTYDRDLGDVLKLQTEIATAVASALKVTLLGDEAARIELGGTTKLAAYDAYLRGSRLYYTVQNPKDLWAAVAAYTQAIRVDANYALAYAFRSVALLETATWNGPAPAFHNDLGRARADAQRAITLAPELADGHLALAAVLETIFDFDGARKEYLRAHELAPGSARVQRNYGVFLAYMGQLDQGIQAIRHAVALDPLRRDAYMDLGLSQWLARRYHDALATASSAMLLDPKHPDPHLLSGLVFYSLGKFQSAADSCEIHTDPTCLAIAYDKLGRHTDAESMLAKIRASRGDWGAHDYATIYAQWGNRLEALKWLETAMHLHCPALEGLKTDPLLDPLRNEPRFQAIERALKFPD